MPLLRCLQIGEMADGHVRMLKSSAQARARKLVEIKAHIEKRAAHIALKLKLVSAGTVALPAGVTLETVSTATHALDNRRETRSQRAQHSFPASIGFALVIRRLMTGAIRGNPD